MKKKIVLLVICSVMMITAACSSDDVTDQIADVAQAEDPHVLGVKNGSPNSYPNQTYGEAFDNFFASPTWKYFVGTREGPDEDGDGEPDYVEDNVEVVEFTGRCYYQDVEVKALIQFSLSEDGETFEATYLSFNDVPQNNLMLVGLLDKVFTENATDIGGLATPGTNVSSSETESGDGSALDDTGDETAADGQEDWPDFDDDYMGYYIFPYSDTVELTEDDLTGLDAKMLTYGRNEIYARHGYIFQSEELNEYFYGLPWYVQDISYDGTLSELEQKNANFILQYQKDHQLEYKPE